MINDRRRVRFGRTGSYADGGPGNAEQSPTGSGSPRRENAYTLRAERLLPGTGDKRGLRVVDSYLQVCRRLGTAVVAGSVAVVALAGCTGGSKHASAPSSTYRPSSVPSVSLPSVTPLTKPVPPSVPGSVNQTVTSRAVHTLPAVPLGSPATVASGLTITITGSKAINAVTRIPGEAGGPGVEISVSIKNSTSKAINLSSAEMNFTDAKGNPGVKVTTASSRPFVGSVKAGATASAVYDFTVPATVRNAVTVTVSYTGGGPVAQFKGAVA